MAEATQMASNVIPFPSQDLEEPTGFYTASEAARIARVPRWIVDDWRQAGIVKPTIRWVDEDEHAHDGYSFHALVYLRLLREMRSNHVSLETAVTKLAAIRDRFGPPGKNWQGIRIFSQLGDVYVAGQDDWGTLVMTRNDQKLGDVLLGEDFARLRDRTDALLIPLAFSKYVEIDVAIKNGHPTLIGTAVETATITKLRGQGMSLDQIRNYYPYLERRLLLGANRYELSLSRAAVASP